MSRLRRRIAAASTADRNTWLVWLDGVVIGLMSAAASFVSVWVIRLGASPLWVSLLSSLPSTVALGMTIPWSAFAGRQRHPERVFAFARLAVHAVYPLVAIVPFFLREEWAARVVVLVWALSAFPSSLSNMMFTLVMGKVVPPDRRAFLMSRRWSFLGVAKLVAIPIASQLIDRLPFPSGYQLVFAINALLAGAAFWSAYHLDAPEQEPEPPQPSAPLVESLRRSWSEIATHRSFLAFIGGRGLLHLGSTLVSAVVPIYWIEHLQASDSWVGYFNSAVSAATLVAYFPWVRIKRRYGTRWTLLPSVLGMALYPGLLALARSPAGVLPVIAFNGLVGAGINLAFFDALLEACPPGREARFVAVNMTVLHLVGMIGPPVGAALLGWMPVRAVLVLGTAIALGSVVVFGVVRGKPRTTRPTSDEPADGSPAGAPQV